MADDDEMTDAGTDGAGDGVEPDEDVEAEPDEPDEDAFTEDDDALLALDADVDDDVVVEETEDEETDDEEDEAAAARTKRRKPAEEEEDDDDEDLVSPDDVEADLDRILKDRMVTVEENEEDEDETDEPEERTEPGDRLQPKRADETLCGNCFLLVRPNAPGCPVGDDDCPIFK